MHGNLVLFVHVFMWNINFQYFGGGGVAVHEIQDIEIKIPFTVGTTLFGDSTILPGIIFFVFY